MSEPEMKFTKNYFLVDPNKASFLDLLLVLFTSDLSKRKFVDSPPETLGTSRSTFTSRFIIFAAVVVQKILIFLRKPLAKLGGAFTFWLNLLDNNGGFFKLIVHLLTGKVVWPKESSATYTSFIGSSDRRVELDAKMNVGSEEYKSMLSLMAAKVAYENQAFTTSTVRNHWKMEYLDFYECYNAYQELKLTEAFMFKASDSNLIVVSFRGTEPFNSDDWCSDLDISWYELKNVGKVHAGFMKALGLQKNGWPKEIIQLLNKYAYYAIRQKLRDMFILDKTSKFILTGHSLGAALAALFPAVLAIHGEDKLLDRCEGVYTFGQPRVGDEQFGEFMKGVMNKHDIKYKRFVYCNDLVPRIPFDDTMLFGFKHYGPCIYFNTLYKGRVCEDQPNKNYFSILWFIPKLLTAVWELIRSFIIPFWKGKDFKENWLMRLIRVMGLLLPGASDHFPCDYVSSMRLGGLPQSSPDEKLSLIV
ncbi:PREDICTED: uncharacterized protein LOC104820486 [Tarenaya hassleriana]|uniref:uncharacterized protein LOC104820486 n=1 Tax=Tarenaya hassleriana TaxID=28532 RepID=UPI00053C8F22|nr:PREDICTED: uncharacterized protein LOC104820486 [Tarenaya hassleriana]